MNTTQITVRGEEFSVETITPFRGRPWHRLTSKAGEVFRTFQAATVGSDSSMSLISEAEAGGKHRLVGVRLSAKDGALQVVA